MTTRWPGAAGIAIGKLPAMVWAALSGVMSWTGAFDRITVPSSRRTFTVVVRSRSRSGAVTTRVAVLPAAGWQVSPHDRARPITGGARVTAGELRVTPPSVMVSRQSAPVTGTGTNAMPVISV